MKEPIMRELTYILLYVRDPAASAAFYSRLLGREPALDRLPTFADLPISDVTKLGLWSETAVKPTARAVAGGSELMFKVADVRELTIAYDDCVARGVPIAQTPGEMNFGLTFVALDPDGHKLRLYAPKTG
jgi:catechol 2,3-dioxygenase-like lactoylglutathione lyase family enzyme